MTDTNDTTRRYAVRREYAHLADGYDARWQRYTDDVAQRLRMHGLSAATPGLLDIGCGTGALLARFGDAGAVGIDPSRAMLRHMHDQQAVCACGEALPFADGGFDTVMSTSALHYAADPARMLTECRRVLRDGGRLLLVDWCLDAWSTRLAVTGLRLMRRPLGSVMRLDAACRMVQSAGFDILDTERFRAWPAWGMSLIVARTA